MLSVKLFPTVRGVRRGIVLLHMLRGGQLANDADEVRPPKTWAECVMALTGVDVLRRPRGGDGRLVRRPLDEADAPHNAGIAFAAASRELFAA